MHLILFILSFLTCTGGQPSSNQCVTDHPLIPLCQQRPSTPADIDAAFTSCLKEHEDAFGVIDCYEDAIDQTENTLTKNHAFLLHIREELANKCEAHGELAYRKEAYENAFDFFTKALENLEENKKILDTLQVFKHIYDNLFFEYEDLHSVLRKNFFTMFNTFTIERDPYYLNLVKKLHSFAKETAKMERRARRYHTVSHLLVHKKFQGIELFPLSKIDKLAEAYAHGSYQKMIHIVGRLFNSKPKSSSQISKKRKKIARKLERTIRELPKKVVSYKKQRYWSHLRARSHEIGNLFSLSDGIETIPEELADHYYDQGMIYRKHKAYNDAIHHLQGAYHLYNLYQPLQSEKVAYTRLYLGSLHYHACVTSCCQPYHLMSAQEYLTKLSCRYFSWSKTLYVYFIVKPFVNLEYFAMKAAQKCNLYDLVFYGQFVIFLFSIGVVVALLLEPFHIILVPRLQKRFFPPNIFLKIVLDIPGRLKRIYFVNRSRVAFFSDSMLCSAEINLDQLRKKKVPKGQKIQQAVFSPKDLSVYVNFYTDSLFYRYNVVENNFEAKPLSSTLVQATFSPSGKLLLGFKGTALCIVDTLKGKGDILYEICKGHPHPVCTRWAKKGYIISASDTTLYVWKEKPQRSYIKNKPEYPTYMGEELPNELREVVAQYLSFYLVAFQEMPCEKIKDVKITDEESKLVVCTHHNTYRYNVLEPLALRSSVAYVTNIGTIRPTYLDCSPNGQDIVVHGKDKHEEVVCWISNKRKSCCSEIIGCCRKKEILYCEGRRVVAASFLADNSVETSVALLYEGEKIKCHDGTKMTRYILALSRSLVNPVLLKDRFGLYMIPYCLLCYVFFCIKGAIR
ncbi:MAG: hypothetical protein AAF335_03655 [Bacteroidota bacterium]